MKYLKKFERYTNGRQPSLTGDIKKDIFIYVWNGDLNKVKQNLNKVDINNILPNFVDPFCEMYMSQDGNSLLLQAVREKNFEMVKFLLENGADVNLPVDDGRTVAQYGFSMFYFEKNIADLLLKYGADINDNSDRWHGNRRLITGEIERSTDFDDPEDGYSNYCTIIYLLEHNCTITESDIDGVVEQMKKYGWNQNNYYRSKFKKSVIYTIFTNPEYQSMIIDNDNKLYSKFRKVGLLKDAIKKKYPDLEDQYKMETDVNKYNL